MKVIELAFCCYAVTDMKRAREFYEGVLNLNPTTVTDTEHGQWTEYEFGPYAVALGSAPAFKPSPRSEEHTSELQSRGLISYAVFCFKKKLSETNVPKSDSRTAHVSHCSSPTAP